MAFARPDLVGDWNRTNPATQYGLAMGGGHSVANVAQEVAQPFALLRQAQFAHLEFMAEEALE